MRQDVDEKLARLPLRYFDGHARGEILSRVTNDIDNIATTLQQSLTQLITSVLHDPRRPRHDVLDQPAAGLITARDGARCRFVVTAVIAKRSQKHFAAQWKGLGELNGHVEEMYTGHKVVKAFGHEAAIDRGSTGSTSKLYERSWKAQFVSGIIFPADDVHQQHRLRARSRGRRDLVANGQM